MYVATASLWKNMVRGNTLSKDGDTISSFVDIVVAAVTI